MSKIYKQNLIIPHNQVSISILFLDLLLRLRASFQTLWYNLAVIASLEKNWNYKYPLSIFLPESSIRRNLEEPLFEIDTYIIISALLFIQVWVWIFIFHRGNIVVPWVPDRDVPILVKNDIFWVTHNKSGDSICRSVLGEYGSLKLANSENIY